MVVVIFDNVDQRVPDMQRAAFIQAQIAASAWDVFVMVALRPETFVRSKLSGTISGYHPRAFTIAPPRFDQLIEKRIDVAIRMLRGELPLPNIGTGARTQIANVADYLAVLKHSLVTEPELLSFCEDISGGNMRLALDYLVAFMACGHVDAQKILERWKEKRRYTIPLHEFARGVMFSEREYYSGSDAAIVNLFECQSGDARETFGVLAVLSMLELASARRQGSADNAGFLSLEEVRRRLVALGFQYNQAEWFVDNCMKNRLVETNLKAGDVDDATHIRVSPTGSYYFNKLVRTFVYVDAVSIDTPICEHEAFEAVKNVQQLVQRIERTRNFLGYLDAVANRFTSLRTEMDWQKISSEIRDDIARAEQSNERAMARAGHIH